MDALYQNIARIVPKAGPSWQRCRCAWCGEYFKTGDEIAVLIRTTRQYRDICPKNKSMHLSELKYIHPVQLVDDTDFWRMISKRKMPHIKLSASDLIRKDIFIRTAFDRGYRLCNGKHTNGIVICRKRGSSDSVTYNIPLDTVTCDNRRKTELFSTMLQRQEEANIYNDLHKRLGDNKSDDYDFTKEANHFIDTVNKIVQEII